jgi:hypothetical protein
MLYSLLTCFTLAGEYYDNSFDEVERVFAHRIRMYMYQLVVEHVSASKACQQLVKHVSSL